MSKLRIYFQHLKCKQKHDVHVSFVYMYVTDNFKLCISLKTRRLTLKNVVDYSKCLTEAWYRFKTKE